jgi:hypothetical protein
MQKQYMKIEYVVRNVTDDGFTFGEEVDAGTTLVQQRGLTGKYADRLLLTREDQQSDDPNARKFTKNCLANYIPGLAERTTIVHIPTFDYDGERIEQEQWNAIFFQACGLYGVPLWTQSSIKSTTFYFVKNSMFRRLANEWDKQTMGHRFAAYIGLLFSEMTDDELMSFEITGVLPEGANNDGVDGCCLVERALWGKLTMQFRVMRINPETGMPCGIGKGMGVPMSHTKGIELNTSQLKMGAAPGTYHVLRNENVNGEQHRVWISCEPVILLKNVRPVRIFLQKKVMRQVAKLLKYLSPDHRVDLLHMFGGLHFNEDGSLEKERQAVIDLLRSAVPWCAELEQRLTRFMVKIITKKIIPSGGIYGWSSALIISDEYGVGPCEWEDAVCFAIRIPTTGYIAIVPLPKHPYKHNLGNVVTSEVATLESGDADGDALIVVTDPYVVKLFRKYLNKELVGGLKPNKRKFISELCPETQQDIAIEQVSYAWMVGTLTTKAWTLIEIGEWEGASKMLEAANIEPMTYKHNMHLYGQPFRQYVFDLLKEYKDVKTSLAWRDLRLESESWNSIRVMATKTIEEPRGLIGHLWNAGVRTISRWNRKNPMKHLTLSKLQRVVFEQIGKTPSPAAYREMRELVSYWGEYWTEHIDDDGVVHGNTDEIYDYVRDWSKHASMQAKAALLAWHPKQGDGFGLKFNAVFANGDGVKLLGYHPDVVKFVEKRTGKAPSSVLFGESKVSVEAHVA